MNYDEYDEPRKIVMAPKKYLCTLDDSQLKCVVFEDPPTEKTTDEHLLKYCSKDSKTRVLVRYPKGHYHNEDFLETFQTHAQILFSENFKLTKRQLNKLLYKFYAGSSHLNTDQKLREKCDKTWDDCGKLTIYIFKLYDNCGCHPKHHNNGHLKHMKTQIRSHFDTMHCLHTSDDHQETMAFIHEIFK
jgi:hypothetical protein